ncbi:pentatricopeptide repeat-containing protein At1g05750, chloroplastic [Cryptomeria japonica]|uniref:pentatricopeptide repeat-containing protein At1g05750, chloroplastic n=1 Tax=Cryptomeria japonica TaxID=3369 RepID=UPI0027DA3E54|nr:pentatricopeptide repeat-containing protein At1g05750, chloroplastic [Cryptomeria japonica]
MNAKCGKIEKARDLFDKMPHRTGISWTAMIAGYMINGQVEEAIKAFHEIPEKITAPWTAMIAGYAHNGHCKEAVELYEQMELAGVKPELKTFVRVLPACGKLAALEQGKKMHKEIVRRQLESHATVSNALMDMYAKCGSIKEARNIFDNMQHRDGVSWKSIIGGYGMNGCAKEVLNLFEQMQYSGTNPCLVTFVCILHACCHAGLVNEGKKYFDCMTQNYNLTPAMEHYGCMVDLLGRAGNLDEAEDFINKMPIKADGRC